MSRTQRGAAKEARLDGECCPACGRAIPQSPLYRLTEYQVEKLVEIRNGDVPVRDGDTTSAPLAHPYALGLIYRVTTHNGRRCRWRLSAAGAGVVAACERPAASSTSA